MSATKRNGSCTLCDVPVFEIKTMNPDGSPQTIGAALPNAMRATLVLTDGSTCDLTFCEYCMDASEDGETYGIEEHLPAIWVKCIRSNAAEPVDPKIKDQIRADQVRLAAMVPLGLVAVRRWQDILKEERPLKWQT